MAHRISTLLILPAAALLAVTTGASTASAQGVAHGDRGTPWNTPDFTPSAHSVRFDCNSPGVC
ncbi:hypothetical protein ACGFRG_19305 [Streptomyces sp. NPDC048696]|uniref:hypothetical protein n=1 Tax=Streptomyces sp. NPDC048696 TaxID=3365585 RepID=UPI00371EA418